VTKNTHTPSYLKILRDETPVIEQPALDDFPHLNSLCQAFGEATGWNLCYENLAASQNAKSLGKRTNPAWSTEIGAVGDELPGRLSLFQDALNASAKNETKNETESPGTKNEPASLAITRQLAEGIANLMGELNRTRRALWQREAELATSIPVTSHPDESTHLAKRLEAVLRGGAEAIGCQAAALYLLNDATSHLKLRATWGLPAQRLVEPARPLRGAMGDLEALTGHAVVIENCSDLAHWNIPEGFASAVCVPVSSSTIELGTLWLFGDSIRDYSEEQTNIAEITAGRLATDLEREVLLSETLQAKQLDRDLVSVEEHQHALLPHVAPLIEGWEVTGWTAQGDRIGGDFHDWFILADGTMAVTVGDAHARSLDAAMTAATLSASVKAHCRYAHDAAQMASRVNHTLWTSSTGDQLAAMFYGTIEPTTGRLRYSIAGQVGAYILRPHGSDSIYRETLPLGSDPEYCYEQYHQVLATGDALVVVSEGVLKTLGTNQKQGNASNILHALRNLHDAPAEKVVATIRQLLDRSQQATNAPQDDHTILVVRRC